MLFSVESKDLYSYQLVHLDGTVKLLELPIEHAGFLSARERPPDFHRHETGRGAADENFTWTCPTGFSVTARGRLFTITRRMTRG